MTRKDALMNLRQVLLKRRDALRKVLAGDLSQLNSVRPNMTGDMVDAALDAVHDEILSQLAEVESRELAQIENALERMRTGQYGICESCGRKISLARLQALPYATLCIKCQRELEQEMASSGSEVDWSRLTELPSDADTDVSINDIEMDVS